MRHRRKVVRLNRDTNHRKMLLRNLVRSLVEMGEITTTEAKAKETKRLADKLIGKALVDSIANRRLLHTFFGKRDVVNTLVDRIAPLFKNRVSGFTSIQPAGIRRGDNTQMVTLALVEKPAYVGSLKKSEEVAAKAAPAPDKKEVAAPAKAAPAKKAVAPKKKAVASKKESK